MPVPELGWPLEVPTGAPELDTRVAVAPTDDANHNPSFKANAILRLHRSAGAVSGARRCRVACS